MNLLPLLSRLVVLRPPVVVVPHEGADVDAVASAVGLVRFFRALEKEAVALIPSLSAPASRLLQALGLASTSAYPVEGQDVVVVDTVSPHMIPVDVSRARRVVMVDHHPGEHPFDAVVYDVRSCSEIVAELLFHADVYDEPVYLALAAGIVSDTAGLHGADHRSLSTLSRILRAIDKDLSDVYEVLLPRRDISERIARLRALERSEIHRFGDYLVVLSRVGAFEASAASVIVQAGADVALVYSDKRLTGRMAPRFQRETGVDLLSIFSRVQSLVGGSFGGHPLAAGMVVEDPEKAARAAVDATEALLRERGFSFVHRVY